MSVMFSIRQGDTTPAYTATVLDEAGAVLNLTGKTVKFVVRAPASSTPIVNAAMVVVSAAAGTVSYAWTAADTATAGLYVAEIRVTTTATSATYTFPNNGYIDLEVVENLSTADVNLVSVADAKDALNMDPLNRAHDSKILRWIRAIEGPVQAITGPIIPTLYDEWYDGGATSIILRHRPSSGYGTTPYLILNAVSEYAGPIEWPLSIVPSPDMGQTYSVMLNKQLGQITRRSAGGAAVNFAWGTDAVHAVYTAGQETVPAAVYEGALLLLQSAYQATAQALRRSGGARPGGGEPIDPPPSFLVPSRVRELLAPVRRHPSLA